ncbi:MAG: STAS domain-containing protein [bacterium]|jgi:anti-anti-sigma regulatory factor
MQLSVDMGLFQARELLNWLQKALEDTPSRQTCTLDASKVGKINTPAVQVLIAAALNFQKQSKLLRLAHPSPVVARAFSDLGCQSLYHQMTES